MRSRTCACLMAVVPGLVVASAASAQSVEDLLPFIPEDANSVSILRVHALTNSPRGRALGWAEKHETEYLHGAVTIPPWVERLVRASQASPGTPGGNWTVALLPLPADYDLSELAEREGTEVQEIAEHSVVATLRHNGYFVELHGKGKDDSRVLGGMSPATRQQVARWIQESHGGLGLPLISDYLLQACADPEPQIVIAFDLEHMLDPVTIRYRLNGSAALETESSAKTALTLDLQTLQGLVFTVRVQEEASARLQLDFGRQIGPEGSFIQPLVAELLSDAGAYLEELEDAQTNIDGKSVVIEMTLSDESLRRVLSLVTAPPPGTGPGRTEPAAETTDPKAPDLAASQRYFKAVNRNIDDLQKAYGRAKSYSRTAHWHDNFAQRIDNLPIKGVDPDLIAYGSRIASDLRGLAASLRGTAVQVNALQQSIVYNVDYTPGYWNSGWGWWGMGASWRPDSYQVTSNLQDVRAKQAEAVGKSAPQREEIWQMINNDRAATERKMIGRYGDNF